MKTNKYDIINTDYKLGFETLVQSDTFAKGLNIDVIRAISAKKKNLSFYLSLDLKLMKSGLKWKSLLGQI